MRHLKTQYSITVILSRSRVYPLCDYRPGGAWDKAGWSRFEVFYELKIFSYTASLQSTYVLLIYRLMLMLS